MSTSKSPLVKEQLPLLRGQGRYVDDIMLLNTVHVAFVRSPYAHARLLSVDVTEAARQPGVLAVFSGEALRECIKPLRPPLVQPTFQATDWYALAWDKVRYVGEAVAVVVAVNRYLAEDAAECVMVEYEPLLAIATVGQSMQPDAPRIHDALSSNILIHREIGTGRAKDAFEKAEIRVRSTFQHPRVSCLPLENCGVLADYHAESNELVVWSSTQVPHLLREALSDGLAHPIDQLRVIAPNVGGGFGLKSQVLPEELLISYLARELQRPVKWTQDRMEHLQASMHSRDDIVEAELAARSDGTLIGVRTRAICDVGAYNSYPFSSALEPFSVGGCLTGPYDFPYYSYHGYAVATNKCPGGPYRGVGAVLGPIVMEGLLDQLANELNMDPTQVRMINLARSEQFPFEAPTGSVYDSGDYPALLDLGMEEAGYPEWRHQQEAAQRQGRLLGIGLSCFVEGTASGPDIFAQRGMTAVPGYDAATLRVNQEGELHASLSTPSQGQGQYTTFAQLLAKEMGVPFDSVHIDLGDTKTAPYGSGTWSSRSLVGGGSALLKAAKRLQEKLVYLAALYWQVEPTEVIYADGAVHLKARRGASLSLVDLSELVNQSLIDVPAHIDPVLTVEHVYHPPPSTTSAGVHLALVEIDRETGEVKVLDYIVAEDCGHIMNEKVVDGQVRGGIVQGMGIALWEELLYDEHGQFLTGSLMDYLVPGAYESPNIQIVHMTTPSPWNDGGFKGVGESGIIGAPAAITNAVLDALQVKPAHIKLPLTPERILGWLKQAEKGEAQHETSSF